MKKLTVVLAIAAAALALPAMASASTTFDPSSGTGFVGKGDVQTVFGLNNATVQNDANNIGFTYNATETKVTEVTWTCTNSNNQNEQFRNDTTTTTSTTTGVTDTVTRVRNQVTGFTLNGFTSSTPTSSPPSTEGPPVNSCPSGPWSLTSPAGPPVTVSDNTNQYLAASDGTKTPAATALDGYNVWHLLTDNIATTSTNPVSGSVNYGTSNGSVY